MCTESQDPDTNLWTSHVQVIFFTHLLNHVCTCFFNLLILFYVLKSLSHFLRQMTEMFIRA